MGGSRGAETDWHLLTGELLESLRTHRSLILRKNKIKDEIYKKIYMSYIAWILWIVLELFILGILFFSEPPVTWFWLVLFIVIFFYLVERVWSEK